MDYKSKFLTTDDKEFKSDLIPDDKNWWSKTREYKFAMDNLKKGDLILDAGCGIEHPFKTISQTKASKVICLDKDKRILDFEDTENIEYNFFDLADIYNIEKNKLIFDKEIFDKIFCLSVLEEIKPQSKILDLLNFFKRILKEDGYIIITANHPLLVTDHFVNYVNASELIFSSEADYEIPKNVLHGPYNGLKCYTAVLEKNSKKSIKRRKRIQGEKLNPVEETKPELPEEIK